jgi:predicted nucleic acid-binding protein
LILVDTSVWIDHFRRGVDDLVALIGEGRVLAHPFVTGELAVGNLREWDDIVASFRALPCARLASEAEFLMLVASERLAGTGLGFVDVHLLVSCRLTPGTRLWSRDRRLAARAEAQGMAWTGF